jgi:DNA-binding MarR family transcriptional regulator
MTAARLSQLQKRMLRWLAADHQRTPGRITSSHPELVRALQGDKGNISHSLRTLEARGWLVIGRSSGGKAESLMRTREGQKWACQVSGSCD